MPVALVAAKCLTALAKGLRKAFKSHAVGVSIRHFYVEMKIVKCDNLGT